MEDKPQNMPSNIQIHNYDLSTLFIETRGWICKLFSDMSNNSGNTLQTYKNSVYYFIQLFEASRHMIRNSYKIEEWDKKEKIFLKFLQRISKLEYLPNLLIENWRCLSEDIVNAGLYDEDEATEIKTVMGLMGRGEI